jgi:hypothetical protein
VFSFTSLGLLVFFSNFFFLDITSKFNCHRWHPAIANDKLLF